MTPQTSSAAPLLVLPILALLLPTPAAALQSPADSAQAPSTRVADSAACEHARVLRRDGLTTPSADYERLLELAGALEPRSGLLRRSAAVRTVCLEGEGDGPAWAARLLDDPRPSPLVVLLPARLRADYLSAYPRDRNNGARWAGRGFSGEVTGGATLRWGVLSAALAPALIHQQNSSFDLHFPRPNPAGMSEYANPWHRFWIDYPVRFGDQGFSTVHPGQSFVRLDLGPVAVGGSTENMWWGPGRRSSILLGNTAAGFPHTFLGTASPVATGAGSLEAEVVWGRLAESAHFDTLTSNDHRLFTGFTASFQPRWVPGLFLGFSRVQLQTIPEGGPELADYFGVFDLSLDNDASNHLAAAYARWVMPESGFEVYGEWAREDFSADFHDLLVEPDHSQAYTLGAQKLVAGPDRTYRFAGELTSVARAMSALHRSHGYSYYIHSKVQQGYTHDGQLLGAWMGPGSDSQTFEADALTPWGGVGTFIERVRFDSDGFFDMKGRNEGELDVGLTLGTRATWITGAFVLDGTLARSRRHARHFVSGLRETNWVLEFGATYRP